MNKPTEPGLYAVKGNYEPIISVRDGITSGTFVSGGGILHAIVRVEGETPYLKIASVLTLGGYGSVTDDFAVINSSGGIAYKVIAIKKLNLEKMFNEEN